MRVVIIGAGIGGLACGIRLAAQGYSVTLLEKNDVAGGRCARYQQDGFTFDTGPTLFMMTDTLDELFRSVGRKRSDYLTLQRIDPAYRITYSDGQTFDFTEKMKILEAEVRKFGPRELESMYRYIAYSGGLYRDLRRQFIDRPLESLSQYVDFRSLALLIKSKPWRTVWQVAQRYFRSPHLQMAFSFHTLYLGISPVQGPSIYSMLPYIDLVEGVYYPIGGMSQVPAVLTQLFQELGGEIRYGVEVEEIIAHSGRVREVLLHDERTLPADIVVSNVDLSTTVSRFLKHQPLTRYRRRVLGMKKGCSAAVFLFGLDRPYPQLSHHNLYLPMNFTKSLHELFELGQLPQEPAFYLCAPSRTDSSMAPPGCESVMVLVPVPNLMALPDGDQQMPVLREKLLGLLDRTLLPGVRNHIHVEQIRPPSWYAQRYALADASTFGLLPSFFQSAMFRPQRRSPDIRGLYFAGASTHPGNGVPIVLIAARLAAEAITQDYGQSPHVASAVSNIPAIP